jgi:hypothetical protein
MQKGSASALFVDTIVISNERWIKALKSTDTSGADYAASIMLDKCGYTDFALVPTTINGTATAEYSGF